MRKSNRKERGIAILTVITALVALMVIAVPFVIAMRRGYEQSKVANARQRARQQLDSTLRFLEAFLVTTTERVEIQNRELGSDSINKDPACDTLAEIEPTLDQLATSLSVAPSELENPYGTILGWKVEDENGKLNINSASFFALGNLIGLSFLTRELTDSESTIELEDATAFPDRGYVKIGRELIKYGKKEGNRLVDCERGLAAGSDDHGSSDTYKSGHWVVNYAAWAIAYYTVGRYPGEYTPFHTLDVSDISRLTELHTDVPVITQADWERVAPYVTCYSKGEVGDSWTNIQPIAEGTSLPSSDSDADGFHFTNSAFFNPATIVRITEKTQVETERNTDRGARYDKKRTRPRRSDFGMVFDATPGGGRFESRMDLFGKVHRRFDGNQMRVEYLTRHPVNINTAPRAVLLAIFSNLRTRMSSDDSVTPEEAGKLADAIIASRSGDTPLRGMKDFETLLDDLQNKQNAISRSDHTAILRNAVNSHDQELVFGTAPITFKTFDVYTLHASCTISDKGGRLLAKHAGSRVVEIGSQITTSKTWETQRDFEEQLIASMDPRFWTTGFMNTGMFRAPQMEPWPRWQKIMSGIFAYDPYDKDAAEMRSFEVEGEAATQVATNGEFRLSPARMEYDTARIQTLAVEHFDAEPYIEGRIADGGSPLFPGRDAPLSGAIAGGEAQPFSVQFWWQPLSTQSGDIAIFDFGELDFRNRFTCYHDQGTDELVFGVCDDTAVERAAELRYDVGEHGRLAEDVWYHIHLVASGCHPTMMQMLVDGRAVGKPNVMSFLTGNLSADEATIAIEDGGGFPTQGAVLVGTEIIEYESASETSLIVRTDDDGNIVGRGRRGTAADTHSEGTTVVVFGYSRPLIEGLKEGGATLAGELGPYSVLQFDTHTDAGAGGASIPFENYAPQVRAIGWQIDSSTPGGFNAPPLGAGLAPFQGGNQPEPTIVNVWLLPFDLNEDFAGMSLRIYGGEAADAGATVEDQMRAFQEDGYCYLLYVGGNADDWDNFMNGGRDAIDARVEFVKFTQTGDPASPLTFTRLDDDNEGATTAPDRAGDWEIMVGYQKGLPSAMPDPVGAPIGVIPLSIRTTTVGGNYIDPTDAENTHLTHWLAQIMTEDDNGNTIWEWFRYSEIIDQGEYSYFLQARMPNPQLLIDRIDEAGWDEAFIDNLTTAIASTPTGPSNSGDPGGDPGGEPPAPPSAPGRSGGGLPDPGVTGDSGRGPADTPLLNPDAGAVSDDGNKLQPDLAPPSRPADTGPAGPDPAPLAPPTGGVDPGPAPGPDGEPVRPPTGGPRDDGRDDDEGPGGGILPPSEPGERGRPGGDDEPEGGPGGGFEEPTAADTDFGGATPDRPGLDADTRYWDEAIENIANVIRFRGVQGDDDEDNLVDDWWGKSTEVSQLHPDGAPIMPVAAVYGGPDPSTAGTPGEDFSVWPLPGVWDNVSIVSGDDDQRLGGDFTVLWAMRNTDNRLYDDTDNDLVGDAEPFDYENHVHLFALNDTINEEVRPSEEISLLARDYRDYNRLICFPSSEMPDNYQGLARGTGIGIRLSGETSGCVIDEIAGDERNVIRTMTLADEFIGEEEDTFSVVSREGTPDEGDLPEPPGILKIGNELVVYNEAGIVGNTLQFSGCVRGVMRTAPGSYDRGTRVEPMFGILVGMLTESASDTSNALIGIGFDRFPRMGVVRLEDPEAEQVELRLYTTNVDEGLMMPINDLGGGIFNGRYGTVTRSFDTNTPVFWQPVRAWDRYAEYSDSPELSYWSFTTQLTDAFIKRLYWKEGQLKDNVNVRVYCRLNEGVDWNAPATSQIFLSRDAGQGESSAVDSDLDMRRMRSGNPLGFLYGMDNPRADNMLEVQADKVEVRFFTIFNPGAFNWDDPSVIGWKFTPRLEGFAIEYVQQNRTRRHIDR